MQLLRPQINGIIQVFLVNCTANFHSLFIDSTFSTFLYFSHCIFPRFCFKFLSFKIFFFDYFCFLRYISNIDSVFLAFDKVSYFIRFLSVLSLLHFFLVSVILCFEWKLHVTIILPIIHQYVLKDKLSKVLIPSSTRYLKALTVSEKRNIATKEASYNNPSPDPGSDRLQVTETCTVIAPFFI